MVADSKTKTPSDAVPAKDTAKPAGETTTPELGGRKGPEPTRYGDWEKDGRCVDF